MLTEEMFFSVERFQRSREEERECLSAGRNQKFVRVSRAREELSLNQEVQGDSDT